MDGLIALLIIIGIVTSISKSNKKKKAAQKAAKSAAQPGTVKIPYTREEWAQYLAQESIPKPKAQPKPAAKPKSTPKPEDVAKVAAAVPEKRRAQAAQRSVPTPAPAPTGSIALNSLQSVEGETEAEHAAHRMRAAQEEQRIHIERAAEQAQMEVNLQALRSAVVMKEILDKPVSLRPRRRCY